MVLRETQEIPLAPDVKTKKLRRPVEVRRLPNTLLAAKRAMHAEVDSRRIALLEKLVKNQITQGDYDARLAEILASSLDVAKSKFDPNQKIN